MKKVLSLLLVLCLVVGMVPLAASAAEGDVAQVEGGNSYASLAEAVEDVLESGSKTGTIKLLKDATGSGIGLFNEKGATGVDLTIDFGGFTYTCQDPAVGSAGTESQGFHFEKGNTVTLKNGTINVDENSQKTKMLIQNYCNLTLENLDLHGSAVTQYIISSNYGDMDLRNVNISGEYTGLVGIDLMHWLGTSYQDKAPTIEIHNTRSNIIEGAIDVYCYGTGASTCPKKPSLKITGGSFSANVSQYVADGYTMIQSGDKYVVEALSAENAVAQVEGNYYGSLQKAVDAVTSGQSTTIILLDDIVMSTDDIVTIPQGKEIVLDLNEKSITTTSDFTGRPIVNNGILTLTGNGTISSAASESTGYGAVNNYGTLTIENGTYENGKNADAATFYNRAGATMTFNGGHVQGNAYPAIISISNLTINGGTFENTSCNQNGKKHYYTVLSGGTNGASMTITGGTFIGTQGAASAIGGTLTVSGGKFITKACPEHGNTGSNIYYALYVAGEEDVVTANITGGDFSTEGNQAAVQIGNDADGGKKKEATVKISGGQYSAPSNVTAVRAADLTGNLTISAGYFTSDPSQYLEEGKAAVESDKAGYNYMVADATETPAEVVPAAPDANVNPDLTEDNKTAAEEIQNALAPDVVTGDGVTAAANSVANQNTVTASDDVLKELNEAISESGIQANEENTTIVVQPYMKITIEDVDVQDQTVTLDITPMYRTVATTAKLENNETIVLEKTDESEPVNAVQIGEEKPLTITKPVTMTLTLPDSFKDQKVYIQHKWYEYSATADKQGEITFTNPHGFSSFTFTTESQAAAKIDDTTYTSLQEAVNHVENGQTIILLKDGQSATVDREVSFTIGNDNAYKATLTPGSDYTMTQGENGEYTFTKKPSTPVTPGPGDDDEDEFPFTDVKSGAWYYDAVKYVYENGLMAGTSDTTFDPKMKLNRAMAAQILYNLEGKPAVTEAATFTDAAAAGEWALDAIAWAQQTGVVAGVGDNIFAPAAQVTREQFAQMMYNYAKYKGYDLTADGDLTQFSDSSKLQSWAVTAMKWANGNGLINGFEDDTLQPAGTTIRGQAASIIMNFDKNVVK